MSITPPIIVKNLYPLTDEAKSMYLSGGFALAIVSNNEVTKIRYVAELVNTDDSLDIPAIIQNDNFINEIYEMSLLGDVHFGYFKDGRFMSFKGSKNDIKTNLPYSFNDLELQYL